MTDFNQQKKIDFLRTLHSEVYLKGEKQKSWQKYAQIYNHSPEGLRGIWKRFRYEHLPHNRYDIENPINPATTAQGETYAESDKTEWDQSGDSAIFTGVSLKVIASLEDAIKHYKIDLNKWIITRHVLNSWGVNSWKNGGKREYATNYQVKLWLEPINHSDSEHYQHFIKQVDAYVPNRFSDKKVGNGVGVLHAGDFHLGADIKDLPRTPDFNVGILIDHLQEIARITNNKNYSEVHALLYADFWESLNGLNHLNSFKSLDKNVVGCNAIILADKIFSEHFLSRINNLVATNMISGNHDRLSANKEEDNMGEGAAILAYILGKSFKVNHNHLVLSKEIDGIQYIMTHGDKSISKVDTSKLAFDYGNNNLYNLVAQGHKHTRESVRTIKKSVVSYKNQELIQLDDQNYRKIIIPSVFTGNWYSEQLGFGSTGGFILTENNGRGKPNLLDISL